MKNRNLEAFYSNSSTSLLKKAFFMWLFNLSLNLKKKIEPKILYRVYAYEEERQDIDHCHRQHFLLEEGSGMLSQGPVWSNRIKNF